MSFAQLRYQFIVSFTPTDEPSSGLPGVGGLFDMKVGVPGEFFSLIFFLLIRYFLVTIQYMSC